MEDRDFSNQKFLISCFGRNPLTGKSNVEISCDLVIYNGDSENESDLTNEMNFESVGMCLTQNAEFDFENRNNIVQVNLKFNSHVDPEMKLFWDKLKQYGKLSSNRTVFQAKGFPVLIFTVVSDKYCDTHFMRFSNPFLWFLQPEEPNDEHNKIISMFFYEDSFSINKIDDTYDLKEAKAESSRTYNVIYNEN